MTYKELRRMMLEYKDSYLEEIGKPHLFPDNNGDYYFFFDGHKIYLPLEFQDVDVFRFRQEFGIDPPRKKVVPPTTKKQCQVCNKHFIGFERAKYCSYPCRKKSYSQLFLY